MNRAAFKGIWIPIELVEVNISWTKRILIAEIAQLEMLDKGCVASNNHFAKKLRLTNQAVSKALNELNKEGFITINNAQSKRNFGRSITINFSKSAINFSVQSKESNTISNTIEGRKEIFKQKSHALKILNPNELLNFIEYWTEHSEGGKKMRWEKEKVFDNSKRQTTWKRRSIQFNPNLKETTIRIA